jgi:hypothetical protein
MPGAMGMQQALNAHPAAAERGLASWAGSSTGAGGGCMAGGARVLVGGPAGIHPRGNGYRGGVTGEPSLVRVVVRPYGSALPLGFFAFGVGMLILGGH